MPQTHRSWLRPGAHGTRRAMIALLAVLLTSVVIGGSPVSAGRTWCKIDPQLRINGQLLNVYIDSADGYLTDTTGPITVVVGVPESATVEIVSSDNGFGYGYAISVERSSVWRSTDKYFDVGIKINVPSTGYHKLLVTLTPENPYTSAATSWPTWTNSTTQVSTTIAVGGITTRTVKGA